MNSSSEIPIGERLRFYRQAQNKKQVVVAGLAGVTEDYLSQIERGLKTPTIHLLHRFARILGVSTSALLGEPNFEQDSPIHPVASSINRVLLSTEVSAGTGTDPDLADLRTRVDSAWSSWQSSPQRYTEVAAILPDLIVDVRTAAGALGGGSDPQPRRDAHRIAADLYFLLRTFTKRIGRVDLSLLAADRAVRAAEDADDPLRIAAGKWNLGHALLAQDEGETAEQVAISAAEDLQRSAPCTDVSIAALQGALWLVAVSGSARNGDGWTARSRLREQAWPAAQQSGEGNVLWTVFGPTNVSLHSVSVEMEAGEIPEALRLADDINVTNSPSIERRTTFALEVARSYDQRHEDPAVFLHLLNAEATGPEDMRYNVLARDLVRGLVKRARPTYAPQVRALAQRIGLLS